MQNKGRDLVECVKKIQRAGMEVQGGFILGFDNENPTVFENLIQFIQKSGIVTAMVGLLNAPKGTKLYDRLMREDRLLQSGSGDNTDSSMNFVPDMNYKDLLKGYHKVVQTIYSDKDYYNRIVTFLKSYKPAENGHDKVAYCDILAFIKSLWLVGVLRKGRRYYWRLVFWGLRRPQYLAVVITFVIYGYHFRRMFEESRLRLTN